MPNLGLNMDGEFLPEVPPNAPIDIQIARLNEVINRLNGLTRTQIFADATTKRMLIGYQENGWGEGKNFGIKISMEGVNVTSATDEQLLFKMDMETWAWLEPGGRRFVHIGMRSTGTNGFEMAKPGVSLNEPA